MQQPSLNDEQRRLVERYVPYARRIAAHHLSLASAKGIPLEDLQQESCYGLCVAALHYDASMGASFRAYCFNWCEKYILICINDAPLPPLMVADDGDRAFQCEDDSLMADGTYVPPGEQVGRRLDRLLRRLNKQERQVVKMLYGIGRNAEPLDFQQVADKMQLHPQRVHQIYEKALAKMEGRPSQPLPLTPSSGEGDGMETGREVVTSSTPPPRIIETSNPRILTASIQQNIE